MPRQQSISSMLDEAKRNGGRGWFALGSSVYLDVRSYDGKNGSALFVHRYRDGDKVRQIPVGTAIGPEALDRNTAIAQRKDHLLKTVAIVELPSSLTMKFRDAVAKFIAAKAPGKDTQARLLNHTKLISERAIGSLTPQTIADVMVAAEWDGNTLHKAGKLRSEIEDVLTFNDVENNPAVWSRVSVKLPTVEKVKTENHAAMEWQQVPEFMTWLASHNGTPKAKALRFAALTAARIGEVVGATWAEIDLKEKLWIIPAERMKAKKEHIVPLSDAALAVIGKRGADDGLLFEMNGKPDSRARATLRHLQQFDPEATQHGLRSTWAVWAEENGVRIPVIDAALAHTTKRDGNGGNDGAKIRKAYLRSDLFEERREAMQRWADFALATGKKSGLFRQVSAG